MTIGGLYSLNTLMVGLRDRVAQTNALSDQGEAIHLALAEQETLAVGHALVPSLDALEKFDAEVEREFDAYIQIGQLAPGDDAIQTATRRVRDTASEWRNTWAEPFLQSAADRTPAANAAELETGAELFEPVAAALEQLGARTEVRQAEVAAAMTSIVDGMSLVFIPLIGGIALGMTVGGVWLIRSISGPLTRLNRTAHGLIAGEDVTFVAERDDEIGALAQVLERMRLDASSRYDSARSEAETAATFNQLAELTSFAQDEATLVQAATRVLQRIAPSPRGQVMLLNNSTNRLIVAATWGKGLPNIGSVANLDRTDRCPGIRRATAYVAEDLSDQMAVRCPAHPAESGSVVCLPMPALGSIVGVIHLQRPEADSFNAVTVQRAARTAEQVALAIANARLMKTMEGLANTDPLTGLRNARFFDAYLEQHLAVAERDGDSVGLIMLDVDHFKQFNDTYGHPAGDEALRALSRAIRASIRESDVVARYGGEEFIIGLHHAKLEDAAAVAEKIRSAVEQAIVEIGPGRYGRITASFGVVATDAHRLDRKGLVSLADAALYRAKSGGRNRVEAAGTAPDKAATKGRGQRRPAAKPAADEPLVFPVGRAVRRRRPRAAGP